MQGREGRKTTTRGSNRKVLLRVSRYGRIHARKAAGIDAAGTVSSSSTPEGRPEGCRDRRKAGRRRRKAGRQAGRLPGPGKLREMLIIRKFDGRKSSREGPDPAGTGEGRGDSSRIGAKRSTAIRLPAPHLPYLFCFLLLLFEFLTSSPTPVPFFSFVPGFFHFPRLIFPVSHFSIDILAFGPHISIFTP